MTNVTTPYITGSPVRNPEMFFGRKDIFEFVSQTLDGKYQGNGIFLYGESRMGKTSVLHQLALPERLGSSYLPVFIDLHRFELKDMNGFLWELASATSKILRDDYEIAPPELDRNLFMNQACDSFENMFLSQICPALGERRLLIMLDEAGRLLEKQLSDRIEYMRSLIMHEKLSFIFSLITAPQEMEQKYAFLFNPLCVKKVSFLDESATEDLITKPVKEHYEVDAPAIKEIFRLTSGHPYYVQMLCHQLFMRLQKSGGPCLTLEDVEAILAYAWEPASNTLEFVWKTSTTTEQAIIAAIAAIMKDANIPVTIDAINEVWMQYGQVRIPHEDIIPAITRLLERDILLGEGTYRLAVDLQRIWLRKYKRLEFVREEEEIKAQIHRWQAQMSTLKFSLPRLDSSAPIEASLKPRSTKKLSPLPMENIARSFIQTLTRQKLLVEALRKSRSTQKLSPLPIKNATQFFVQTPMRRKLLAAGLLGAAVGASLISWGVVRSRQSSPQPTVEATPTFGTTLNIYTNHSEPVLALAWSSNGERIVSGSQDHTAQIWNAMTGKDPLIYKNHTSRVNGVAWDFNKNWIASGSSDETVQIWDAITGKTSRVYRGHKGYVNVTAWSPDMKQVVSGSQDRTVQVWDATTGNIAHTYTGHSDSVYAVAWSPKGQYIASGGADGTIIMWDTFDESIQLEYQGHSQFVVALAWSPDGKYFVTGGGDNLVKIWDASTGNAVYTYSRHTKHVYAVAWSPNGKYIASGGKDMTVQIWEAASGHRIFTYTSHFSWIGDIAWSPNGKYIASGGDDRTVRVWVAPI
jgi:WD40 repeat protein